MGKIRLSSGLSSLWRRSVNFVVTTSIFLVAIRMSSRAFFVSFLFEGPLGIHETRLLGKKLLLELGRHSRAMFIDGRLDAPLLVIDRVVEIRLETAGDDEARIVEPAHEQFEGFIVVESDAQLAMQFAHYLHDLRGITHARILPFFSDRTARGDEAPTEAR